jgi:hypothetical protein
MVVQSSIAEMAGMGLIPLLFKPGSQTSTLDQLHAEIYEPPIV